MKLWPQLRNRFLARKGQLGWLLLALPGLAQLGLLLIAVLSRWLYPYDLEWMEGGLLAHAQRLADGSGIYRPPSVEFIPYLYTPLYPALVASLGSVLGISYALGRAISIASIAGIASIMAAALVREAARRPQDDRPAAWVGAAMAVGFFAASYPWVEGWYDLVRADSLFLAMVLGGLLALRAWAHASGARVAAAAALLALSFFCKQTGVMYVALGGVLLLVQNWRRLPLYVGVAGTIGLGGTAIFNRATTGWFWTYIYEVHQVHDFNMDRFYQSFLNILWKFPLMTVTIAVGLLVVALSAARLRRLPRSSAALLYWAPVFALSCLVGALGWGTQWAHFNAYMPAMATGALACGASFLALLGWARELAHARASVIVALVVGGALGLQLLAAWWSPHDFIPTSRDVAAGDALIDRIAEVDGDVWVPYHPWYAHLAGKRLYTHRMGILDVTYGNAWTVSGLREAIAERRFAAIVLDNRPPGHDLPGLHVHYRLQTQLPATLRPRLYTGAAVEPAAIWIPQTAP